MDGANRIALGIVAAAVLLIVGLISYREYQRQRDIAEAQAVMQSLSDYAQQAVTQGQERQAYDARQRADRQQRALDARRLADDQQCVAGTVVQVSRSSYTQVAGAGGRPVACSGRYSLQ